LLGLGFGFAVVPNATLRSQFISMTQILPAPSCLALVAAQSAYADIRSEGWRCELLDYLRSNLLLVESFAEKRFAPYGLVLRQNTEATYLAWFDARDVIVPVSCSFIAKFVFVQVYFIVGISFQAGTSPGRDGKFSPYRFFVQAGVALSDGEPFGGLGFVRLNFACPRTVLLQGF